MILPFTRRARRIRALKAEHLNMTAAVASARAKYARAVEQHHGQGAAWEHLHALLHDRLAIENTLNKLES